MSDWFPWVWFMLGYMSGFYDGAATGHELDAEVLGHRAEIAYRKMVAAFAELGDYSKFVSVLLARAAHKVLSDEEAADQCENNL